MEGSNGVESGAFREDTPGRQDQGFIDPVSCPGAPRLAQNGQTGVGVCGTAAAQGARPRGTEKIKPGALGSTALAQARESGVFTPPHDAFWAAARKTDGDTAATRELIDVLLPPGHGGWRRHRRDYRSPARRSGQRGCRRGRSTACGRGTEHPGVGPARLRSRCEKRNR